MEQRPFQHEKVGDRRSTKAGACQHNAFEGHVATDGSLLGKAGKWIRVWLRSGTAGWTMKRLEPLPGMYGSMEAELEVQRTIKRTELATFWCLLKRVIGPIKVHM